MDAMPWATLDRAGEGYEDAVKDEPLSDEPIEKRTLKELVLMHQKATLEAFGKDNWIMSRPPMHERSAKMKMSIKIRDEYQAVRNMPPPEIQPSKKKKKKRAGEEDERAQTGAAAAPGPASADAAIPGMDAAKAAKKGKETDISKLIDSIDDVPAAKPFGSGGANAIVEFKGEAGSIVPETKKRYNFSAQIGRASCRERV